MADNVYIPSAAVKNKTYINTVNRPINYKFHDQQHIVYEIRLIVIREVSPPFDEEHRPEQDIPAPFDEEHRGPEQDIFSS